MRQTVRTTKAVVVQKFSNPQEYLEEDGLLRSRALELLEILLGKLQQADMPMTQRMMLASVEPLLMKVLTKTAPPLFRLWLGRVKEMLTIALETGLTDDDYNNAMEPILSKFLGE